MPPITPGSGGGPRDQAATVLESATMQWLDVSPSTPDQPAARPPPFEKELMKIETQ